MVEYYQQDLLKQLLMKMNVEILVNIEIEDE